MYEVNLSESYFPAQRGQPGHLTTIGTMLRASVAAAPDRPALKELGDDGELRRRWTYAELLADSERLARALSRYRPGERIAVCANNIPEWVLLESAARSPGSPSSPSTRPTGRAS